MKSVNWSYIFAAYLALLSFGLLDNVRGPFFPDLIQDMKLRDDQASWFFALTSIIAFFGSIWAPKIQTLFGALNGLRLGLLLLFSGFYMTTFANDMTFLLLASSIFGLGMGMSQVFEHICIQEGAPLQLRRRLFNGLHSFYAAASILAPLSAGWVLNKGEGWRFGFKLVCILPMLAFIYTLFVKNQKQHTTLQKVLKAKGMEFYHMLYLSVILSLYVTAELSISTRLVLYVQRTTSIEPAQSTFYLTTFFIFLLLGRLLMTIFDFKSLSSRQIIFLSLFASLILYAIGLWYSPWLLALCGLTMAPMFGMTMDYIAHTFPSKSSYGISLSFAVGAVLIVSMHYFVGLMTEWYSIRQALILGPVFLALSIFLFLFEKKFFKTEEWHS
ncbi:MAG: MFS transporter [Bdellovibrionales bacterium]|nr:MFS transporter [Bdellovibrionales bacterium]